jgi:murein DD-endopeptidase MepM/ murein hydrolase activator NlpD
MSRGAQASSKLFSLTAMLFAAALLVGMSVPANAFISSDTEGMSVQADAVAQAKQTLEVSTEAVEALEVRDAFSVTSYAELLKAKYGSRSYNYNVTSGAIRWPFPYAVPISSGFGDRVAPCRSCSSYHGGLDFNPGGGVPIYAIADGVVSFTEVSDYGFGNHVFVTHTINGQKVESVYAHMQMNSIVVATGQPVKAGDLLGLVGSTGQSTGDHLHFEVRLSGVAVDPFAWLKANAV